MEECICYSLSKLFYFFLGVKAANLYMVSCNHKSQGHGFISPNLPPTNNLQVEMKEITGSKGEIMKLQKVPSPEMMKQFGSQNSRQTEKNWLYQKIEESKGCHSVQAFFFSVSKIILH